MGFLTAGVIDCIASTGFSSTLLFGASMAFGVSNGTMSILVPVGATYVINAVTAGGAAASIVFWGETY